MKQLVVFFSSALIVATLFPACSDSSGGADLGGASTLSPRYLGIENSALKVGETVSFYGENFLSPEEGRTKLVFEGAFLYQSADGQILSEEVPAFTIVPLYDGVFSEPATVKSNDGASQAYSAGTHILRWNRFGPFKVPFTVSGDRVGTFKGTVQAINEYNDGTVSEDVAQPVSIEIKPSIIVTKLEPIVGFNPDGTVRTAECGNPALRAHSGMPYVVEVKAIGFEPEHFIYRVSGINEGMTSDKMVDGWVTYKHMATPNSGGIDRLGDPNWPNRQDDEIVVFDGIAENADTNIAGITVTAIDANNNHVFTALPLTVVRPLQLYHDGREELAEYYEPKVVHPAMPGSIATKVCYSETETETRQKAVSVTISKSFQSSQTNLKSSGWSEGISASETQSNTNSEGISHSESESSSESYGTNHSSSASNSVQMSSNKGSTWGWSKVTGTNEEDYETKSGEVFGSVSSEVSSSVTGEGSIPGFAKVSGTVGTKLGVQGGAKKGNTTGKKLGSKEDVGQNMSESEGSSEAFGSTTVDSKSVSISGTYGVQSQDSINKSTSETAASTNSQTFSTSGTEGVSKGVVEGESEAWSETFVTTESQAQALNRCDSIPNGACAVIFRQTVRYVKTAQLYSYDLCGVRSLAGELHFNSWKWVPDIQSGADCENVQSKLPKAKCLLACD